MLRYSAHEYPIPHVEKTISQYIGILGEKLALKYLIENGFKISSFMDCVNIALGINKEAQEECLKQIETGRFLDMWKERLEELKDWEKAVKELLGRKWNNFALFCEAWKEEPEAPSGKSFDKYHFGFDYVAKKGSKIYFVEVKTNEARLRGYQRKMMKKAREFGFNPMIVRTRVSIAARMKDVTTETF